MATVTVADEQVTVVMSLEEAEDVILALDIAIPYDVYDASEHLHTVVDAFIDAGLPGDDLSKFGQVCTQAKRGSMVLG